MTRKTFFTLAALMAAFCHDGKSQTKLSLTQLPGCALSASTPTNTPIILAIVGLVAVAGVTLVLLPSFADGETPGGMINGTNASFTLAFQPLAGSLLLFRNGLLQQANVDYTLSAAGAITFLPASIPGTGDILQASYRH